MQWTGRQLQRHPSHFWTQLSILEEEEEDIITTGKENKRKEKKKRRVNPPGIGARVGDRAQLVIRKSIFNVAIESMLKGFFHSICFFTIGAAIATIECASRGRKGEDRGNDQERSSECAGKYRAAHYYYFLFFFFSSYDKNIGIILSNKRIFFFFLFLVIISFRRDSSLLDRFGSFQLYRGSRRIR